MNILKSRWVTMLSLVLAGESIYMLPFMRKTFQTSIEQVFQVTSLELGIINSVFGVLALISYFPGGQLADRFSTRNLLTLSLLCTGGTGLLLTIATPGFYGLLAIHALWGISSILTFWAPLIKATRNWGKASEQGTSFGLLDGGRGLVGALLASLATGAYATFGETAHGSLNAVIMVYCGGNFLAAMGIWLVLPGEDDAGEPARATTENSVKDSMIKLKRVVKMPQVWFLSVIIFCAYFLYVGTFDFPAYAEKAYDQSKVFGATLGTFRDWLCPVAAIGAGLIADRIGTSRAVLISFAFAFFGFGSLYAMSGSAELMTLLWVQVCVTSVGVFALRAVYYALIEEGEIPRSLTGTTVGIVSVIGYTPEIFAHLISGAFVDSFDGVTGYQYYFVLLSLIAFSGIVCTYALYRYEQQLHEGVAGTSATTH